MRTAVLWTYLSLFGALNVALAAGRLSGPSVPGGLGVNIHFTDPRPGEMEMLAAAGFRWIRMDFGWEGTERKKGRYDFSAYDRLLAALDQHKIRAVLILDYSNRHYDNGLSPSSDEGRKAFRAGPRLPRSTFAAGASYGRCTTSRTSGSGGRSPM